MQRREGLRVKKRFLLKQKFEAITRTRRTKGSHLPEISSSKFEINTSEPLYNISMIWSRLILYLQLIRLDSLDCYQLECRHANLNKLIATIDCKTYN